MLKQRSLILMLIVLFIVGVFVAKTYTTKQITNESPQPTINSLATPTPILNTSNPTPQIDNDQLKQQILQDLISGGLNCDITDANGNTTKDNCRVDQVTESYAKGIMPQAYWIAEKKDNRWTVLITGNGFPECKEIDSHSIPKEIYGNCIEQSGELRD